MNSNLLFSQKEEELTQDLIKIYNKYTIIMQKK